MPAFRGAGAGEGAGLAAVFGLLVLAAGLEAFDLAIFLVGCAPAFLAGKEPPNMIGATWVVKGRTDWDRGVFPVEPVG